MTESIFDVTPGADFDALDPANISPVVVALCSDDAQHITGQVFHIWGGAINILRPWTAGELFSKDAQLGGKRTDRRAGAAVPRRDCAGFNERRHATSRWCIVCGEGVMRHSSRLSFMRNGVVELADDTQGVEIDRDLCVGSGMCESLEPTVFQVGDDGVAFVLRDDGDIGRLREAADRCPSERSS